MSTRLPYLFVCSALAWIACGAASAQVVEVKIEPDTVYFVPSEELGRGELTLSVSGPRDCFLERDFREGETAFFEIRDMEGQIVPDGEYSFNVVFRPILSDKERMVLRGARQRNDPKEIKELKLQGVAKPRRAQGGTFRVTRGQFVYEDIEEKSQSRANRSDSVVDDALSGTSRGSDGLVSTSRADFVIIDDLIVDGSACIGFDCVNGESFGFDTIRIKENNLRIKFDDTSTAASFPRNDWQLTANDSANGGASKFSIDDISGNRTPFTVEANAPSHSLYVDDGGRIGMGTSTPSVEIHTIDGDTPALRLQQDGSSGFAPQTWDVAGNETSFFIRDATNGSTLPFRIRPGASSNALVIADGGIGFGTLSPDEELHAVGTDNPRLLIEDTSDNANDKPGVVLRSPAAASGGDWAFEVDNGGNFQIDFGPSPGPEILFSDSTASNSTVTINGDLLVNGTCTGCDDLFQPDYPLESLEDHAAFMFTNSFLPGVGPTPEGQTTINVFQKTTGLLQELEKAHIYIFELHRRLEQKQVEMESLRTDVEEMSDLVGRLERLMDELNR